jgi:hypothetical protein
VPGLDRIAFEPGTFASAAEVFAATATEGGSAVIRFGSASLTLFGVTGGRAVGRQLHLRRGDRMRRLTTLPALALALAACGGERNRGHAERRPPGHRSVLRRRHERGAPLLSRLSGRRHAPRRRGRQRGGPLDRDRDGRALRRNPERHTDADRPCRRRNRRDREPRRTEYVRFFRAEPLSGDPVFGVLGFPSAPGDLPGSGRISFTGAAEVLAADATRLYTLDGTAFVVADFGGRQVRIELRDLRGTAEGISPGNTGTVAVPGGGRITVDGSAISGAGFSGGRASGEGLPFGITASADASGTSGGFFGPGADEVAGRVVVIDGDVEVLGSFAAD